SDGREHHRGGLAAVHNARPLRSGLSLPLQVQPAAHRRLPEPVRLRARPLSGSGHRRDGEYLGGHGALLRESRDDQSASDRADRAGDRLFAAARPSPSLLEIPLARKSLWRAAHGAPLSAPGPTLATYRPKSRSRLAIV